MLEFYNEIMKIRLLEEVYSNRYKKRDYPCSEKDPKSLRFFRKCPNFLTENCQSNSWGSNSPCWKCFKEQKYNPKNAEQKDVESLLLNIKGEKCR